MVARSVAAQVLIADTAPTNCRVFEAKLTRNHQFQVVSATTASAALQASYGQNFDLLLWDMRLPGMSEILPLVRALSPHAALLLMTTDDRPRLAPEIVRLDVTDTLIKPFSLDTLLERVEYALNAPRPLPSPIRIAWTSIGQQILLIGNEASCTTRVLEYGEDSFFVVAPPRIPQPSGFTTGMRLRVEVRGEDALYSFETRLLRAHTTPVSRWECRMPTRIRREQRRKHTRLPMHLEIVVRTSPDSAPDQSIQAVTANLSLGGFALVAPRELPIGSQITFDLHPPELPPLHGTGCVVRSAPLPSPENPPAARYYLGVSFNELPLSDRQRLRTLLQDKE